MRISNAVAVVSFLTLGVSETALAYVGPGAGLSLLGALWGLLAAVLAASAFVILWPLRRMRRRRQRVAEGDAPAGGQGGPPDSSVR